MQTVFKPEEQISVYIDSRECKTHIVAILKKQCDVREKQLDVADYLLSENVACERKTEKDFIKSIMDRRLFDQVRRLKESYKNPFMIIEGENIFETGINIHPNAVRGALASIAIDYTLPVIWTKNQLETANMLFSVAKREQTIEKKDITIRGKRRFLSENQQQEFLISGLSNVSIKKAKNLLKHFNTPERIFTASEIELQKADGIGKELARRIRYLLTKDYEKSILED